MSDPSKGARPADRQRSDGRHRSDPSTDPGGSDPYGALYRTRVGSAGPTPRPLGQYEPALVPPEEQQEDDTYGWLFRPEPAEKPAEEPTPSGVSGPEASPSSPSAVGEQQPVRPSGQAEPWLDAPHWDPQSQRSAPSLAYPDEVRLHPAGAVEASPAPTSERPRRFLPLVLMVLLVAALFGALVAVVVPPMVNGAGADAAPETGAPPRTGAAPSASSAPSAQSTARSGNGPYLGPVRAVSPSDVTVDCQAAPATDAGGNPVRYVPDQMYDGDPNTAWRCDGEGKGQSVTFSFGDSTKIGGVALVNGYTKVDPTTGEDRYPEYRRVTQVTWTFPDGTSYVQQLVDGNEKLQQLRIPVTKAKKVTLTINEVTDPGSRESTRNAVLISEVGFSTPE
ncbi:hypothetical protein GCM10009841_36750 [Microlunatus panaciterrae]|uniref:NAD glycohydrolase translocation F5/8 type C domain-containing protein n=1 Tax=Microlunatus panaciterrae TaxID=400768 RepID=A0ABS2RH63_9ACTN|nr:discoidin domain-containing protein [Microlunatus panaciterrae]MBM7798336.1 hypothetical protein [Microlunatus panaciterrae]